MLQYREPLFRPPAEADSLILQAAYGCPHNHCRFCGMYKGIRYQIRPEPEFLAEITRAGHLYPDTRRIFLADGDCMALPPERLLRYLSAAEQNFPRLARVNTYANGSSILAAGEAALANLRRHKLHTLYVGLESGCQEILDLFGKMEQADAMTDAVITAQRLGFHCSVMVLIGLGGKKYREKHIARTAALLNRMQPRLLSALRYIRLPGRPPPPGFEPVSEYEATEELRELLRHLALTRTVFRANHTSNPVPLAGRLPQDRELLIRQLDAELASGRLDRSGEGATPLFL